ncbi:MAG: 3-hydroxyacyl-CoA dehydrogenase NAD-binding domain-containing protein [Promethearchaeota archaeon]
MSKKSKDLERVSIIGTGVLGTQISMIAAYKGYEVTVFDLKEDSLTQNLEKLRAEFKSKNMEPLIPWDKWDEFKKRIKHEKSMEEAILNAELIIEAVPEKIELKRQIFKKIGEKAIPEAIIATNSSSIPVSHLEESSGRPEYCLNIHFYFPLQGLNIVDVMGGTHTSSYVFEKGVNWVRSIGFIPLTVKKELLGFCFNRVWRAIKRETLHMWANDYVDFTDIDRAWMVFTDSKEGPFGIMDKVGLDVVYDIEMVYFNDSKDSRDHPPEALLDKIKKGELGIKTGKGFYSYPNPEYLEPDFLYSKK